MFYLCQFLKTSGAKFVGCATTCRCIPGRSFLYLWQDPFWSCEYLLAIMMLVPVLLKKIKSSLLEICHLTCSSDKNLSNPPVLVLLTWDLLLLQRLHELIPFVWGRCELPGDLSLFSFLIASGESHCLTPLVSLLICFFRVIWCISYSHKLWEMKIMKR